MKKDKAKEFEAIGDKNVEAGNSEKAIENYKSALSIVRQNDDKNTLGTLYIKLANTYYELKDIDNYVLFYEKYLELFPDGQLSVLQRLAYAYYFIDTNKSIEYHDRALLYDINDYDAVSIAFAMIKSSDYSQSEVLEEAEYLMTELKETYFSDIQKYYSPEKKKSKDSDKKLNIGYLSSDCHSHIMMNYILPIWENHNKKKFNITVFNSSSTSDTTTAKIKSLGLNIIDCEKLEIPQLAQVIFDKDIDILVDLGGFTNLRSLVHFYKPAPIILSYLGYLNTLGIDEVDYIIANKFMLPKKFAKYYKEKPLYLPKEYQVFEPSTNLLEQTVCPFEKNGYITFGSFNCVSKLSNKLIRLWVKILQNVPNSKLLIYRTGMSKTVIKRLSAEFERHGVSKDRIEYNTTTYFPHFKAYELADVSLDSYPFSGMSICLETALCGVPTVTLKGEALQSNGAASVLNSCGLSSFIAVNDEEYIEVATRLAKNSAYLQQLRGELREIVRNSPICTKHKEFTRSLERKYRKIWKEYCEN